MSDNLTLVLKCSAGLVAVSLGYFLSGWLLTAHNSAETAILICVGYGLGFYQGAKQ